MIPYLVLGFCISIFCFILIFIWSDKKDKYDLSIPNHRIGFVVTMMLMASVCFINAKGKMYHNTSRWSIETTIKTKSVDNVVKSDTLIRIIRKINQNDKARTDY